MNISLKQLGVLLTVVVVLVAGGFRESHRPTNAERVQAQEMIFNLNIAETALKDADDFTYSIGVFYLATLRLSVSYLPQNKVQEAVFNADCINDDGTVNFEGIDLLQARLSDIVNWSFIPGLPLGD